MTNGPTVHELAKAFATDAAYEHLFRWLSADTIALDPQGPNALRVAAAMKETLRAAGWMVAVSNDYVGNNNVYRFADVQIGVRRPDGEIVKLSK